MFTVSKKNKDPWRLKIERLVFGGEGMGYYGGRPVFVAGVFPGEEVMVKPLILKRKFVKAELLEVIVKSVERREAKETHFISCSPWQIMPEEYQLTEKKALVKNVFKKIAHEILPDDLEIIASPNAWEYRNKEEFSFANDNNGRPILAFNKRYLYDVYLPLNEHGCLLAPLAINECAQKILQVIRKSPASRTSDLKNLTVRYSFATGKCLAILYVKRLDFPNLEIKLANLAGLIIVYSKPESPAAVVTKELFINGEDFLSERLNGKDFFYLYNDFFQINPAAFSLLLQELENTLLPGETLIDLYSGTGAIGFSLAGKFKKVYSAEISQASKFAAEKNIIALGLENKAEFLTLPADNFSFSNLGLNNDATVIVDPPRGGLEGKILKNLIAFKPKTLVYISCNPATQARDWNILKEHYQITTHKLFDFYPQTPHMESLLILERK